MNSKALQYYSDMSKDPQLNSYSVKNMQWNDFSNYDSQFILNYANKHSCILDLGSGTGLTVNKLYHKVQHITAVDLYPEFTKFITEANNIEVINADISVYIPEKEYDLITFIGVLNFFDESEVRKIYKRYRPYLKNSGHLIVKNQFGISEDIVVSGYSKELGKDYFSHYRYIAKEISILQECGYNDLKFFDIYPAECNRWDNTHFYAIVATKQ